MLHMFIFFSLWHLADGVKRLSVMEGDSVTLHIDDTFTDRIKHYWPQMVVWKGPEDTRIATLLRRDEKKYRIINYNYEIFGDRVQIDKQTASLTISNIRITDSGHYNLYGPLVNKSFNVTVYYPIPVITRHSTCSSSSSSSVSKCVLLCSVLNVSAVSLSWYKGNSLLSSISVSDLLSSVSLHLEVDYQDNDTYSCVLNNSFTNRTEHLDITQLCQDSVHFCGFTEAVIRSVISAVVGVATVAVLVYDIKSRRAEDKRRTSQSVVEP